MKVGDLEVGMMITPVRNRWTDSKMSFNLRETEMTLQVQKPSSKILSKKVLMCDITAHGRPGSPEVGIYMGKEKSEYWMSGVKTHHRILVGDSLARISGYEFRWIEPVS